MVWYNTILQINSCLTLKKPWTEELTSLDKNVLIIGNFNIDLLKCETSQISHDFLMSLQSHYLIPTVHESIRVHRNSAMLIDNVF